jgi:Gpi18-like mannosyltransferase
MKPESEHPKSPIADLEEHDPTHSSTWRRIIPFWLITRVWLSLLAFFCSLSLPSSPLEKKVAGWPPSAPPGEWLTRVVLEPWNRWDVEHFLKIATRGYSVGDGTLSFHPLHPMLGKFVGAIFGGHTLLGLFLVSNICCLLFLFCFMRLARFDLTNEEARRATQYFMLLPAAFVLFAPYTEPLFLLLSALALLMARRGKWFMAGLAGGMAALTRQQGIILLLPLAWEFWEWSERSPRKLLANWRGAAGLLLVPAGLLTWLLYRAFTLSDVVIELRRPGTWIYGLLISQSVTHMVPQQSFMPPWKALWIALNIPNHANLIDLCSGAVYLLILAFGGRMLWRLRPSYFLYSLVIIVISFSYSTGNLESYMGLSRHCLLAFPLAMPLAIWGRKPAAHLLFTTIGLIWLFAMSFFYVGQVLWVP